MFDPVINSKLNRLLEGGGYSENIKEIIASGELTDGVYTDSSHKLEVGKEYTLKLDGGTYNGIAVDIENAGRFICFGNIALLGDDFADVDTGESYCVGYVPSDSAFAIVDSKNGKTFSLATETETIHPIDPKYLPGVCLPVVELSTVVTATLAALTETEGAQLDSLNGEPFVLKCVVNLEGTEIAVMGSATFVEFNGMKMYSVRAFVEAPLTVSLANNGSGWNAASIYG